MPLYSLSDQETDCDAFTVEKSHCTRQEGLFDALTGFGWLVFFLWGGWGFFGNA